MKTKTKIRLWLNAFGFDHKKFISALRSTPWFFSSYFQYKSKGPDGRKKVFYPCLSDRFDASGTASGHYFHQDLWVAQQIFHEKPVTHVDIGSRVDGFVAHVAAFRSILVGDIRPLHCKHENIKFMQLDLVAGIPEQFREIFDSVSCLHTIEHIGLGRYGDTISQDDYKVFWNNLCALAKVGATIYISTPVGKPALEFNAHRISAYSDFFEMVNERIEVASVALVDDAGEFSVHAPAYVPRATVDSWEYGLAILKGVKRPG